MKTVIRARIEAIAAELAQPQLTPGYQLLKASHLFGEHTLIDLYGTNDKDGIEVCDVTLAGQTISLCDMISWAQLEQIGHVLELEAEIAGDSSALDARISAAEDKAQAAQFDGWY